MLEANGIDESGCPYQIFRTVNLNGQNGSKVVLKDLSVKDAVHKVQLNF